MNNTLIGAIIIGAVLGTLAFFNITPFHDALVQVLGASSPAGSTASTAKVASVVLVPTAAGTNATSSSIYNTDAFDRIITDNFVSCAGATTTVFAQNSAGLVSAGWRWTAGTTSAAVPGNLDSLGNLLAMNVTVATGTYDAYTASSTYTTVASRRWPTATYLTFLTNGTTTPSISCVVGVHYVGS